MTDILTTLKDLFTKLVGQSSYVQFVNIIIVAITAYNVAKYNTSKPGRLKIKQLQLENVYLPLHRLFNNMPAKLNKTDAQYYSKSIENILDNHYLLAFPQLHTLNQRLNAKIINNEDYIGTLKIIKHQVDIDYELLKKALGYPHENPLAIIERMTLKQRLVRLALWVNALFSIFPVPFLLLFVPVLLFKKAKITKAALIIGIVFTTIFIAVIFFLIGKIDKWAKKNID